MSKRGDELIESMQQMLEYTRGARKGYRVHRITANAVREARLRLGMTQEQFSAAFAISPHTLKKWEQGRRVPEGPAQVLLQVIREEPKAVLRALEKHDAGNDARQRKRAAA